MKTKHTQAIFYAILAATLYAINAPFSKILLTEIPPTLMAALLYLGAGIGLGIVGLFQKSSDTKEKPLTRADLPYTFGMIALDIAAPICLMIGLTSTTSANASLLNNFEIVATSLIAFVIFREAISRRLWLAIGFVTLSSLFLSFEDASSLSFSVGSLFVLLACICWGLENNCTRMLSDKNPLQIVMVKGLCSGSASLLIGLLLGEHTYHFGFILCALLLGFVAYGLSIFFYIYAQRTLGAAKTSAYYALAPFIGVVLSLMISWHLPHMLFWIALAVMAVGTYLASTEG